MTLKKYCSSCSDGPMLKEEAIEIKKCLEKVEFKNFTASNGWLEKWKISYGVRERKVNGEAGEVAEYTVSAWMERLVELTRGYELADIWNMDETGCFFKALPEKGLAEKKSQARIGKIQSHCIFRECCWGKGWWYGGVKKRVALKTLRVYSDPMAFITTPIRKHE